MRELRSPKKTPLDDVILAVLALGTNEVETMAINIQEKTRSPFNSPLTSTQWLDVYGSVRTSSPSSHFAFSFWNLLHLFSQCPSTFEAFKTTCWIDSIPSLPKLREGQTVTLRLPDNSHRRTYHSDAIFSREERRLGEHRTGRIG